MVTRICKLQQRQLNHDFYEKWEKYLRKQWNDFYPNGLFDELKSYYPADDMSGLILNFEQRSV
jgi:hypothetical protein